MTNTHLLLLMIYPLIYNQSGRCKVYRRFILQIVNTFCPPCEEKVTEDISDKGRLETKNYVGLLGRKSSAKSPNIVFL